MDTLSKEEGAIPLIWEDAIQAAAEAISQAEALIITAGAGMGVDSGLPDFRGTEGFWKAYPPYQKLGVSFVDMANPDGFRYDPPFAWGFYGHRLNLYRDAEPHAGFAILKKWALKMPSGCFVMTSNVDGHFQSTGFSKDKVWEVHGSLEFLQCSTPCYKSKLWRTGDLRINVNLEKMRAEGELPRCAECGDIARPNILMFGDYQYISDFHDAQYRRFESWLKGLPNSRVAIIEFGAGTGVPTVRIFSQETSKNLADSTLIRVNPREPETPRPQDISIGLGGLQTIRAIDERLP